MTGSSGGDFKVEVDVLLRAAFDTGAEADLVRRLRSEGSIAAEVSTPFERGGIGGYALLSWMEAPKGWLCLAPVAVNPAIQRSGVGTRIVALALNWAANRKANVVVVGDPDYYGARGFSRNRAARLITPYPVKYTLLAGPGNDAPERRLLYPMAFGETV